MAERVLCVCAHPDDEVLLCGGTLARHVQSGDTVMVLALNCERGSRGIAGTDVETRRQFLAALTVLGITQNAFCNFPDQQFDTVSILSIIQHVEDCLHVFLPDTVYTHWQGDLNRDHRIVHEAVCVACRPVPGQTVTRLLFGEGGEGFEPHYFVELGSFLSAKIDALRAYDSEMREYPHPRSYLAVQALAEVRGATAGINTAEAFMVGRICA